MTENTPGVQYDARHASAYDRKIRELIPGYDLLHQLAAYLLKSRLPERARILVAGSGTGMELMQYAGMSASWRLTGVEPSEPMCRIARQRIADTGLVDRVDLIQTSLIDAPVLAHFNAATALLVSHFVPDDGARLAFFCKLSASVSSGGMVLVAELTGDRNAMDFQRLMSAWRLQQDATRLNAEQVAQDFEKLAHAVYPLSSKRWQTICDEAGLRPVLCFWQSYALQGWYLQRI